MTDQTLEGHVAIVTGGGMGPGGAASIGEAVSRLLGARGARVTVADISAEAAARTVDAIVSGGGQAIAAVGDLSREDDCRRVVAETLAAFGRLDILVNNLGIGVGSAVSETDETAWDMAMGVNVKSVLFMAKHALPRMTSGGAVVNLSTTAIDTPSASAAYGASKAAVESLTKHIALQYGPEGVRCNTVRPGEVWTAMVERGKAPEQAQRLKAERRARSALLTDGYAQDVAEAVVFLASPAARWITGQTLSVDGGSALIRANPDWRSHGAYWKAGR